MRRFTLTFFVFCILVRAQQPDLPAAERAYEQQVKAQPTAELWQKLGLVRHLQNKFTDAIPALRESIRLNPSLWTSHLFLGIGLYRTNQFPSALASLEKADKLAPKTGSGRDDLDFWLAAARIAMKQPLSGLARLEQLLQRNPKHVDALELAVRTYADVSSDLWNAVAEKHFETPAGLEVHGYALEAENNRPGAMEAFRGSRAMKPERAGPGLALGRLLLREGKPAEALDALQRELRLPEADAQAAYLAGLALTQLGRHKEAAVSLEAAAKRLPDSAEVLVALSQTYLALKEPAKALEAARAAANADPSSQAAQDLLMSLQK